TQVGIGFAQPPEGMPATCVRMFDGQGVDQPPGLDGVYGFPAPGRTPWEAISSSTYLPYDKLLEWSLTVPPDVDLSAAKVQLVRRKGSAWQAVDVTFGQFTDDRFHGLWIIPGPKTIDPGTYAILVSGSSLPSFGYQLIFDQCDDVPTTCDVLEQDCGAGDGCYEPSAPYCRKSGGIKVGEACRGWDNAECEPGAVCSLGFAGGSFCARYCDALDATSAKSCDLLCPNLFSLDDDVSDMELGGAHCFGGIGDQCNPLAPDCNGDQACFGYDPPLCQTAGTTPAHGECDGLDSTCAPGSTCVGIQGSDKLYCQPYCDPASGATGAKACATLCPDNFWPYDGFGLCIPND
ncbi:MAG TPA: hypothetical protein VEQ58_10445, partial [Polyangiaceae bacterium]|nr:hypothetical protein [Polyangiaceae bacterium]